MALQYDIPYSFTGPDGTIAVVGPQDLSNANYVGMPDSITSVIEIRENTDNIVEGDGAVPPGNSYYGRRIWTFAVLIDPGLGANVNPRFDQLKRATHAMRADGTMTWTETGRAQTRCLYRLQAWTPSDDKRPHKVFFSLACADFRVYTVTPQTGSSPKTNGGTTGSPPTFTFTPSANGTVILTNTTAGYGSPAVTLTVGTGYLAASSAVTVDFNAKTVTQGGVRKDQAVVFPTSTWWEVIPGANTWTITGTAGTSSVSISFRDAWL